MKPKAVWISCILTALFCGRSANARVIITLDQVGPNVVATGSGTVDLTGLTTNGVVFRSVPEIAPSRATLRVGPFPITGQFRDYTSISGPTDFGNGGFAQASTGSGEVLGFSAGFNEIVIPFPYVSGTPLSGTATWNNTTIADLGATPGSYTWTWGSGVHADSMTLFVTPEPGTLCLLGTSVIGLAGMVRRKFKLP